MSKKRKRYAPEEKVRILKQHLLEGIAISEICDQYGVQPTVFYRWQRQFFERGTAAFAGQEKREVVRLQRQIARLEEKVARKNEVLGELMEEHVALKKSLGEA